MRARNDENTRAAANGPGVSDDLDHSRLKESRSNANPNIRRGHFPVNLAALREAVDYLLQAIIALDLGDKDHARGWLDRGATPAAKAFPLNSRESYGLALVYGALLEAAAA